jgi:hypothetical protein
MAVRRISPDHEVFELPGVRIWREEFEKIVGLVGEFGDPRTKIYYGDFEADSIADFDTPSQKGIVYVDGIWIESQDKRIELRIEARKVVMKVSRADSHVLGVTQQLREVLRRRARWTASRWVSFPLIVAVAIGLSAIAGALAAFNWGIPFFDIGIVSAGAIGGAGIASMTISILGESKVLRQRKAKTVSVRHRSDAPTFWDRKKDDLWIAGISALVGGGIGYAVNELTNK